MADQHQLRSWLRGLARRLEALGEWEQRSILLAQLVVELDSEAASTAFSSIIATAFVRRTPQATIAAESAQLAALRGHWPAEHRARVREAAAAVDEQLTLRFLPAGIDLDPQPPDDDDLAVPDYGAERPLTLGERRSLALKPSRNIIERAMLDPHPMVAAKLLDNPKLTEEDVVRMAARRPGPPAALIQIALHPRWRRRQRVALALVYNSYLPIPYGLSLLPRLDSREAADVAADARLDQAIREGAGGLLRLSHKDPQLW
jgi:hypothetical protein